MYKLQSTNLVVLLLMMLHFVIYIELKIYIRKPLRLSYFLTPTTPNTVLNLHFMIGHLLNCLNKVPSLTLTPAYERTG